LKSFDSTAVARTNPTDAMHSNLLSEVKEHLLSLEEDSSYFPDCKTNCFLWLNQHSYLKLIAEIAQEEFMKMDSIKLEFDYFSKLIFGFRGLCIVQRLQTVF
jgi:hypothetical protein